MRKVFSCHYVIMYSSPVSWNIHHNDVIMSAMASQITSLTTVYSGVDQRKHQSSVSLAFVRGIHQLPVNFPYKGPVTGKMLQFDDVIIRHKRVTRSASATGWDQNFLRCIELTRVPVFSCDQAALQMVFSVCLSVCPSVHLSVCPSHLFDYVPIIVSSWNLQELLPMTNVRSMQKVKVRGQRSRSQRSQPNLTVSGL